MNGALKLTLLRALAAGSCASVLSAGVLLARGRREVRSAAAPLNAVSHWYWDRKALHQRRADIRHTALGYLTHHGASVFWGGLFAALLHRRPAIQTPARIFAASATTSAVACFVDFKLTPQRLTPGFEHQLSSTSLAQTYMAFAVGLALGYLAIRDSKA